jgi:hypothetical protein
MHLLLRWSRMRSAEPQLGGQFDAGAAELLLSREAGARVLEAVFDQDVATARRGAEDGGLLAHDLLVQSELQANRVAVQRDGLDPALAGVFTRCSCTEHDVGLAAEGLHLRE